MGGVGEEERVVRVNHRTSTTPGGRRLWRDRRLLVVSDGGRNGNQTGVYDFYLGDVGRHLSLDFRSESLEGSFMISQLVDVGTYFWWAIDVCV